MLLVVAFRVYKSITFQIQDIQGMESSLLLIGRKIFHRSLFDLEFQEDFRIELPLQEIFQGICIQETLSQVFPTHNI